MTQATAITMAHSGADGGRSHGGGMDTDSREPKSKGNGEDPGDLGGALGRGVDPGGRGVAGATEDRGGAEGMKEPDRAEGMKGRGEAGEAFKYSFEDVGHVHQVNRAN